MAQIDWTLLLLVGIVALAVIGLILALQTRSGRGRLADAALKLAESLIAYAMRWLERNQADVDVPTVVDASNQINHAGVALAALKARRNG